MTARWLALVVALGCGARSDLETPELPPGALDAGTGSDAGTEERTCWPNCTVGHECCLGGCDGPTVPTENGCCECLPGEVSTFDCDQPICGGD
jgi:hypothetical protein